MIPNIIKVTKLSSLQNACCRHPRLNVELEVTSTRTAKQVTQAVLGSKSTMIQISLVTPGFYKAMVIAEGG